MIAWMIYVVVVTLLLSVAALIAEQAARQKRMPTRWIWALTIVSSLLIPTVISSVSIQLPSLFAPAVSQRLIVLRDATSVRLPFAMTWMTDTPAMHGPDNTDVLLKRLWKAGSASIFTALFISGAAVMWRKRQWTRALIDGAQVFVAPDVGPAVVGLVRPHIVIPAWLMQAPAAQQNLVIAHEQSHLDALDPQLLSIALCLLVSMPWNLPLWWQLHRLRRAIEVDCDARVVRSGRSLAAYGETLLVVGQRQSGFVGVAAAMSENTSFLEQRIKIMLKKPARWSRAAAVLLGCLSLAMVAVAAEVSPPNVAPNVTVPNADDADFVDHPHIVLDTKMIDNYVGNYQLGDNQVLTVLRDGSIMRAQITQQPIFEPLAMSQTEFNTKTLRLKLTFVPDAQGRASAVVFHYKGNDVITAPRIDDALARQINDGITARVNAQTAAPGTEAALRRLIDQLNMTPPNFGGMSAQLAKVINEQYPVLYPHLAKLGPVKSVEFVGVADRGGDKYLVRYEHGSSQWVIALDAKGVIVGLFVSQ